ncbi:hypothetical protein DFS34DRAFT_592899 [Phlyctochytrium arcticum]|nr:hypothetical protein DFS34DRAFT_592899 [Phlyctochytrium arcticum]
MDVIQIMQQYDETGKYSLYSKVKALCAKLTCSRVQSYENNSNRSIYEKYGGNDFDRYEQYLIENNRISTKNVCGNCYAIPKQCTCGKYDKNKRIKRKIVKDINVYKVDKSERLRQIESIVGEYL